MAGNHTSEMAYYPVYIRKDQIKDLKKLKALGHNPAQIIRIGLDRELELKKQEVQK